MSAERCFHCGEPIPRGVDLALRAQGRERRVCCAGCLAVAELIEAQGLGAFYAFRSAPSLKPRSGERAADAFAACDRPEVARRIARPVDAELSELRCKVSGVNCAACAWLIDRGLRELDGVAEVGVNPVSGETSVRFAPGKLPPSAILETIAGFGFEPRPALDATGGASADASRSDLKRLAVAGLGFAQVMTLSAALYLGAFKHMAASFVSFFVLASMLVATPVVLYAGAPIFRSAWADLKRRRLGMDVPVSLAIGSALGASLFNALRGSGEVYFDSATMFVFFLTLGRFLESRARHKAGGLFDALADLKPLTAQRRNGTELERVGAVELAVGDRIVVAPGETVAADGTLVSAEGSFDESLLSGESAARVRRGGETVLGGSLNVGAAPIEIEVARLGADSYVEHVGGLLHRAIADRPDFLRLADRWAAGFIAALLLVTVVATSAWLVVAPERAFAVALSMLVVTCPCALSLAAPTAFAVALGRLARRGLLLRSTRVLERLGDVDEWFFDKTGTLTEGRIGLAGIETYAELDAEQCTRLAAALETGIEHPIARAFAGAAPAAAAEDVIYRPGFGTAGTIAARRYRLGSARHLQLDLGAAAACVYLGREGPQGLELLARFELADTLRPSAREAVAALRGSGASITLVSGDAAGPVAAAARRLGIARYAAAHSPEDKLRALRARQDAGHAVAAVGDGINDAPLLAQADVSVALVAGSRLAQAGADIVFTGRDLRRLARLPAWAAATRRIVRENLAWAALYNLTAVPLAAFGLLAPWMAALGMSLSSLVVVGNALRLDRALARVEESAEAPVLAPLAPGGAPA